MRFWDSSAIIPLLVMEKQSEYCVEAFRSDNNTLVWTMTKIEVFSPLCRRMRNRSLEQKTFEDVQRRLDELFGIVYVVFGLIIYWFLNER